VKVQYEDEGNNKQDLLRSIIKAPQKTMNYFLDNKP